jgi:hypothetical protein
MSLTTQLQTFFAERVAPSPADRSAAASGPTWNEAELAGRAAGFVLLCALASANGSAAERKREIILDYARRSGQCEGMALGWECPGSTRELTPAAGMVRTALKAVLHLELSEIRALIHAAIRILETDNRIHAEERAALQRLSLASSGVCFP